MYIYILYHYWDTPDNEGVEILGAFFKEADAASTMRKSSEIVRSEYDEGFWDPDFTWEDDCEIHFGHDPNNGELATIYAWEVEKTEVR